MFWETFSASGSKEMLAQYKIQQANWEKLLKL
jgi:hypothetical protein